MPITVTINGTTHEVPADLTVKALVAHLGLAGPVAVEVNREIIPRAEHAARAIAPGDAIEIVHFVGGG